MSLVSHVKMTSPPRVTLSRRTFVASLKAVIDSRHANIRRHTRRPPASSWIGEMIVVKEYDQMESLRQILESPARIQPDPIENNNPETIGTAVETDANMHIDEESINGEPATRKHDGEEQDDGNGAIQQDSKRRKVIDDTENGRVEDRLSPDEHSVRPVNPEKENVPPHDEVPDSTASSNNDIDREGEM